jgi:hypothetical protein
MDSDEQFMLRKIRTGYISVVYQLVSAYVAEIPCMMDEKLYQVLAYSSHWRLRNKPESENPSKYSLPDMVATLYESKSEIPASKG